MRITLNGKATAFENDLLLRQLVQNFCRQPEHVIAEVNGEIVKTDHWDQTVLKEGDVIELVGFVGGG
ncbi:MAG: sulfur carrier protein ThiS [Candidatus Omnitrophica bacterium]|nr:sulfur carrier protein ThiS [Candidatus Omnitrophota bacterium]